MWEIPIISYILHKNFLTYQTAEAYKKDMGKVYFPNYENFSDVNKAYENFFQKLMSVIDKLAPFKTKRVKSNSQEWFHGEVLESYAL